MRQRINAVLAKLDTDLTLHERIDALHEAAWFHAMRRSVDECTQYLDRAGDLLADRPALRAQFLGHRELVMGYLELTTVKYVTALETILSAREQFAASLTGAWQWRLNHLLAMIHQRVGSFEQATEAYRATIEIARSLEDELGENFGLNGVGVVFGMLGDYPAAERYFTQCLDIALKSGSEDLEFTASYNLCQVYISTADLTRAAHFAYRSMEIAESQEDDYQRAYAANRLALVLIERESYDEAEAILTDTIETLTDDRDYTMPLIPLFRILGKSYIGSKQFARARDVLQHAVRMGELTDNEVEIIQCYGDLVAAHEGLEDYKAALSCNKRHFELHRKFNDQRNRENIQLLEVIHRTREAETELRHQKQLAEDIKRRADQDRYYFEQMNKFKDEFISSATHDLKNPLSSILLNTQIIRRKTAPEIHPNLDRIERQAYHMNNLVSDMLDIAKLETGKALDLQLHAINDLISDVIAANSTLATESSVTVDAHLPHEPLRFYFDYDYLYRACNNLMSNAIKYNRAGGNVHVTVNASVETVHIIVADTGVGIDGEDLPHIFKRFYRIESKQANKIEGTGLGLSIVRLIVEQHNGTITVTSEPGEGTTFNIVLPNITEKPMSEEDLLVSLSK